MANARALAAITGASSGIGAAFARSMAGRGYDLLLIARRTGQLEALGAQISQSSGAHCEILTADLSVDADLERVAARAYSSRLP